ncbi:MAG: sensor domain-containing diguanylate cyclase [Myxococcales bacterium]|nr:sensor domain-containing diguanylate cyclase [Myxococcales bacterium]
MSGKPSVYSTFEAVGRDTLSFLQARLGFDLWLITRVAGDEQTVIAWRDRGCDVVLGQALCWSSFPGARPPTDSEGAEAAPVGACIGVPLLRRDGSLLGRIYALHPGPRPGPTEAEWPMLELLGRQLGALLDVELEAAELARQVELAEAQACRDPLTGLLNRRGWESLLATEEQRCLRYGHAACVLMIDLDELKRTNDVLGHEAGDRLIEATALALRGATRSQDVVARVGGDEFVVLGVECGPVGAQQLLGRIQAALAEAQIEASVGLALRDPLWGLGATVTAADEAMYREKHARRAGRRWSEAG